VKQGESVESLAAHRGLFPETIWDAPENDDLRQQRGDPHVLKAGDRIFIPRIEPKTESASTGQPAEFVVNLPKSRLQLKLAVGDEPRKNQPYVLTIDGKEERGTTDGGGLIDHPIDPRVVSVKLTVGEGDDRADYTLDLRALDPVAELSGAQGRLNNLGYDAGPVDGMMGPRTRGALCAFQRDSSLSVTGELDQATRDKLKQLYGC
jgi:N-acetylmuramoyl-L-alanine amidase